LLGLAADAQAVAHAITPLEIPELETCGLLVNEDGRVRSRARLTPFEDLVVASDHDPRGRSRKDYVPGLNNAAETMAALLVRRPCGTALDVGTGCGVVALIAARYSGRVVATDVNPRALGFGRLGAALNAIENVEWREGSLFEPVRGEEYDSVLCNAPFVVSPDQELAFRDSGMPRDSFCESLVRGASAHLTEGGIAHLMVSWTLGADADWTGPLRDWVEGASSDAWLLRYDVVDPVRHAESWTRETPTNEVGPTFQRWLAYFDEERIDRVAYGTVYLRRREGPVWVRADELPPGPFRPATEHVLRVVRNQDLLAREGDQALHGRPLRVVEEAALRQWFRPGRDGWRELRTMLYLTSGLRFRVELEPAVAEFVGRLAGAALLDIDPLHLPAIRRLAELGFLELG
jgi:SAM-dependent methyltransferase